MSNSTDNSPVSSPTTDAAAAAAAAAAPASPISDIFWCHSCDRSIVLLVSSPPLTCPCCGTDNLEQMEPQPHHQIQSPRHPTFDDFDNDDDDYDISYFLVHHLPPPALVSPASDDELDFEGSDPRLDEDGDRGGRPSPAPKSSIDAIPDVEITPDFLGSDDDSCVLCAVCKDELAIGSEAKRLPCSHVYHGDCIVPWLSQSNSCPVCRSRLPIAREDGRRRRRVGSRVVRLGDSLEEEGGLDELARVAAASNRMWFPMLSQSAAVAAANDGETVLSRWVTDTEGFVGIDDGMDNDGWR